MGVQSVKISILAAKKHKVKHKVTFTNALCKELIVFRKTTQQIVIYRKNMEMNFNVADKVLYVFVIIHRSQIHNNTKVLYINYTVYTHVYTCCFM